MDLVLDGDPDLLVAHFWVALDRHRELSERWPSLRQKALLRERAGDPELAVVFCLEPRDSVGGEEGIPVVGGAPGGNTSAAALRAEQGDLAPFRQARECKRRLGQAGCRCRVGRLISSFGLHLDLVDGDALGRGRRSVLVAFATN